eukprot:8769287-Pyramimonas_sp.AAC.1
MICSAVGMRCALPRYRLAYQCMTCCCEVEVVANRIAFEPGDLVGRNRCSVLQMLWTFVVAFRIAWNSMLVVDR